eukprot:scaffold2182_cov198-Amphora_coffeaeformis.AAC.1
MGISPLLHQAAPLREPTHRGEVLQPVMHSAVEKWHHLRHRPADLAGNVIAMAKSNIQRFRKEQGVTDASLLRKAADEIESIRNRRHEAEKQALQVLSDVLPVQPGPNQRSGFMVLGMHRSGTSMLSGLLVIGMGYKTGSPLIGGAFDNPKGFFELIPAVLQNDEFMAKQRIYWSVNVIAYDSEKALKDKESGAITFNEGKKALAIYNNPDNVPYLQKDPRMCITLKTWLPLLNHEPAVIFTYRHPLEVAMSLKKREHNFSLDHGLRLWIVYNMRAIQNSQDLCRVTTSNEAVLANPLEEVRRLANELTTRCGVPPPPKTLAQDDVDKFIDPNLQHNKKERDAKEASQPIITTYGDDCVVREYETSEKPDSPAGKRERSLYLKAMKIYCDFKSGAAYKEDYEWPELN